MFKKVIAWFLIICLQCLSSARLIVDIGFNLNKNLIVAKLCENRNKPQMHCLGKCYQKKMQKKAESQKTEAQNLLKEFQYVLTTYTKLDLPLQFQNKAIYPVTNPDDCRQGWPSKTFHPPGFSPKVA